MWFVFGIEDGDDIATRYLQSDIHAMLLVDGLIVEFLRQRQTERPDSASRVEDNDFAVGADFDARSIPAVPDGGRAGRRRRIGRRRGTN